MRGQSSLETGLHSTRLPNSGGSSLCRAQDSLKTFILGLTANGLSGEGLLYPRCGPCSLDMAKDQPLDTRAKARTRSFGDAEVKT